MLVARVDFLVAGALALAAGFAAAAAPRRPRVLGAFFDDDDDEATEDDDDEAVAGVAATADAPDEMAMSAEAA